ncbi:MAG: tetratricopeptide repeat protein [Methylococcaceae bacterium]|nr:tetratricopeptide repeat protein [Methylococcaceae bacterium]
MGDAAYTKAFSYGLCKNNLSKEFKVMKKTIVAISLSLLMTTAYSVELSDTDQAKFNTAVKAYRMNQGSKALQIFTELYNDYPQNQQIKNNYAVALFTSGKLEQAEEVLSSVIESNKEVNIAYKNLNKIYDYAAAKAYSNALGTEKEVTPQKLQIIETLTPSVASISVAANRSGKSTQFAENLSKSDAINSVTETSTNAATEIVASNATETAKAPVLKTVSNGVTNKVQSWADNWSKADINSYVAKALKDNEEPVAAASVKPAVLNPQTVKADAVVPVAMNQPVVGASETQVKQPATDDVAIVEDAVRNWAVAWSKGDADSYITYYEPTFRLGKMSHNQWIKNRKERVTPAENIQVKLADLIVTPSKNGDHTMIAYFKQNYQASRYQDNTSKQLIWKKIGDKWFIQKETKLD